MEKWRFIPTKRKAVSEKLKSKLMLARVKTSEPFLRIQDVIHNSRHLHCVQDNCI